MKNFVKKTKTITEIVQFDNSTYFVKEGPQLFIVNSEMAVCDCHFGAGGKFCKHLCAVERKYGAMFKTSLLLNEFDRQNFARLALGDEFSPQFFEDIKDTSATPKDTNSTDFCTDVSCPINADSDSFELSNISIDTLSNDKTSINENYKNVVANVRTQLNRITDILETDSNPANTNILIKFSSNLSKLQTPCNIISFICEMNTRKNSRKINVQPTSIARRKNRNLPCSGRIQSGRPAVSESLKRKRVHNISSNINNNEPTAKKH